MPSLASVLNLLSQIATPATIISAIALLWVWRGAFARAVRQGPQSDIDWMVLGVVVSFSGQVLDNSFWGTAWNAHLFSSPWRDTLFQWGPGVNLFFRQAPGIAAALCHIQAARITDSRFIRRLLVVCWASAAVYGSVLMYLGGPQADAFYW